MVTSTLPHLTHVQVGLGLYQSYHVYTSKKISTSVKLYYLCPFVKTQLKVCTFAPHLRILGVQSIEYILMKTCTDAHTESFKYSCSYLILATHIITVSCIC